MPLQKTLVVYYSKTGNNRYLAERFAGVLDGDIVAIEPKINRISWLLFLGWIKWPVRIKKMPFRLADYDQVVLCGPIWTGQFISPLRSFLNKYKSDVKQLYYATCCGIGDAAREIKFGYLPNFRLLKKIMGDIPTECEAFPIPLIIPADKKGDEAYKLQVRLSDENFKGEILERFEAFVRKMNVSA